MILITGAARGLGASIACALAEAGHDVVVHHNKSDPSAVLTQCRHYGVRAESIKAPFSEAFVEAYVQRFPETIGLVNNVGHFAMDTPRTSHTALM